MRSLDRVMASLSMEETDRPPVTCMTTSVTLDQMDALGVYWPEAHHDPSLMAGLARAAHDIVGFESVRIPFCLTVEAEILGAEVDTTSSRRTPMVKSHPLRQGGYMDIPDDVAGKGRAKVTLEALRLLKEEVGGEVPVIPLVTGPFTLAGHLVGMEKLLLWIIQDPGEVHRVVDFAASFLLEYMGALDAAGADVILMSNPSASADMISPEMYREFSVPQTRRAISSVENAKTVLHICGDSTSLLDGMVSVGTDGLSVEEKVDPFEAVDIVNGRAALIGNVGVINPLLNGTPEQVVNATERVMEAGFEVINPGCGLAPEIPLENLRAMVRTVKRQDRVP